MIQNRSRVASGDRVKIESLPFVRFLICRILPATLALILFGIGWNVIGDRLNDILNPRVS